MMLHNEQQENQVLKNILVSRGIAYESELDTHKVDSRTSARQMTGSMGQSPTTSRPSPYQTGLPVGSPPTNYQLSMDHGYTNGRNGSLTGSAGHTPQHHTTSPSSPLVTERSIKQESSPVADMPGIFEKEPQLGIDFILA